MAKGNRLSGIMASTDAPRMSRDQQAEQRRYRAEDDLRCLTKACEIQRDRGRMLAVKQVAKEQIKSLNSVTGKKK